MSSSLPRRIPVLDRGGQELFQLSALVWNLLYKDRFRLTFFRQLKGRPFFVHIDPLLCINLRNLTPEQRLHLGCFCIPYGIPDLERRRVGPIRSATFGDHTEESIRVRKSVSNLRVRRF